VDQLNKIFHFYGWLIGRI